MEYIAAPEPSDTPRWDLRPIQLLQEGWALARPHYLHIVGACFVLLLLDGAIMHSAFLGLAGVFIANSIFFSGMIWFMFRAYLGEAVDWKTIFEPFQERALELLLMHAFGLVLVSIGFACFMIPGVYLLIVFQLAPPLVMLSRMTAWESLKHSRRLVHRQLGDFVLLGCALIAVNMIAAIPACLGLLVSVPATLGAYVIVVAQVFARQRGPRAYVDARLY